MAEHTVRLSIDKRANLAIDCPTRAARLDDRAVTVEALMTDLCFSGNCSVVNAAIDGEAATDAAAQGDIKYRIESSTGAVKGFTEGCRVGIIIDLHRSLGQILEPLAQLKICPALNL